MADEPTKSKAVDKPTESMVVDEPTEPTEGKVDEPTESGVGRARLQGTLAYRNAGEFRLS